MATYDFSTLGNGETLDFDPGTDRIFFDQEAMAASGVTIWEDDQGLHVQEQTSSKAIVLAGMTRFEVTTGNMRFADGSRLLSGDNALAANDDSANSLTGTTHGDHLMGWGGDDTLSGGAGGDWLEGGNQDDHLYGGGGNDRLNGGDDQDTLDGGTGADTMAGGAGDDVFYVNDPGDVVTELEGGGSHDRVIASINNYALPAWVNDLTLAPGVTNGNGNTLDNILTGNSEDNGLNGGAGADTMIGGAGNDSYAVDSASDVIVERAGQGTDRVFVAYMDFRLPANVEDLVIQGTGTGTGNGLDNRLYGSDYSNKLLGLGGNDTLDGGGPGNDTLNGGAGADEFRFTDNPNRYNADTILDFVPGTDHLTLLNGTPQQPGDFPHNNADYGAAGALADGDPRFYAAAGATSGHDADDRLVYNTDTGRLFYDPDGSGPEHAELIFILRGAPALTASDIVIADSVVF